MQLSKSVFFFLYNCWISANDNFTCVHKYAANRSIIFNFRKRNLKKNTTRIVHLLLTGAYSLIFPFHEHRGNTRSWSPIVRLSVVLGRNFVDSSYQTLLCWLLQLRLLKRQSLSTKKVVFRTTLNRMIRPHDQLIYFTLFIPSSCQSNRFQFVSLFSYSFRMNFSVFLTIGVANEKRRRAVHTTQSHSTTVLLFALTKG